MTYKTYNCNAYTIHTIKTDKFKTCHMEIIFRKPVVREEVCKDSLLADVLMETSQKYPLRKDVMLHLEDLYKMGMWAVVNRVGNVINTDFVIDFIAPEYINEKNYLEEALTMPFEMIENPNVINDEFASLPFKLCQKRAILDAKSIEEDALRLSVTKTLETLGSDSPTSLRVSGTEAEIKKITPNSLYKHYQKLYKDHDCDIFLIGNLDMDAAVEIIKKHFHKRVINKQELVIDVTNPIRKKVLETREKSEFLQTNLNVLFNLQNLSEYERDIVFNIYNYILGSGGLTSKLYQEIREKNSYCYAINSMYLKHDNLLLIHVSLDKKNQKDTVRLIKKVIKMMANGEFTEEELADAKRNYELSLSMSLDNQIAILNNYVFKVFNKLPDLEERIELIRGITFAEIVQVAKKLKLNTIYALEGKDA